jgi:hypothetical protein
MEIERWQNDDPHRRVTASRLWQQERMTTAKETILKIEHYNGSEPNRGPSRRLLGSLGGWLLGSHNETELSNPGKVRSLK